MSSVGGLRVLLTRGAERDAALASALEERGATVVELACVRVEPLDDVSALAQRVRALGPDDWLVVTSANGVDALLRAVPAREIRARLAVVGAATGDRATAAGLATWRPTRADGAALAVELPRVTGRVLLARADRARPDLPAALRARGFQVDEAVAYRTIPEVADHDTARRLLASGAVDVVVFASASAVEGLLTAVTSADVSRHAIVAIGAATALAVRSVVGREPLVAGEPSVDGLLRAIASIEVSHVARS